MYGERRLHASGPGRRSPLRVRAARRGLLALAVAALSAGCGGGSSSGGPARHTLSGTVSGAVSAGVSVALSGAAAATASTDASGRYRFEGLADGQYTVSPSLGGYTFSPASRNVTMAGADQGGQDFTSAVGTHAISGAVLGAVAAGVTVTLTDAATAATTTATTNAGGGYAFGGLSDGDYVVTAALAGYAFAPASLVVSLRGADISGRDFTASAAAGGTHALSGQVAGAGKGGVLVTVSSASAPSTPLATTLTAADGTFLIAGLVDGDYEVTPSKEGYAFTPTSVSVAVAGADATAQGFSAAPIGGGGSGLAITGKVLGWWVSGVTVTLSGAATATTTTDAAGAYRFSGLPAGTYTVTPSLAGYAYAPAKAEVALQADTVSDFTATSVVPSYTLSGTVAYTGSSTGNIHVKAYRQDGGWMAETVIARPGRFDLRGLQPGTYELSAFMDVYNVGYESAIVPSREMRDGDAVIADHDVSGVTLTLQDPTVSAPAKPDQLLVMPGNGSAIVMWRIDSERASKVRLSWGTDAAASNGSSAEVGAQNDVFLASGLTDGKAYYFKVVPVAGTKAGPASDVVGPITIGAGSGGLTVTGDVTFPGTARGPLYVVLYNEQAYPPQAFLQRVAAPTSPQPFSISGLPAGSYETFVFVDMNGNGVEDTGDLVESGKDDTRITLTANTSAHLRVNDVSAEIEVRCGAWRKDGAEQYSADFDLLDESKLPVAVTLVSGNGLPVPIDVGAGTLKGVPSLALRSPAAPGDRYQFLVMYDDGSSETLTATLAAPPGYPTALAVVSSSPYSRGAPLFTWADPSPAPAGAFTYRVEVVTPDQPGWSYPQDKDGMPGSQHQVAYGEGPFSTTPLATGTSYQWQVTVYDADGNHATQAADYTP